MRAPGTACRSSTSLRGRTWSTHRWTVRWTTAGSGHRISRSRIAWFGTLNARLTKTFPRVAGRSLDFTTDVYNVLHLISRRWGQSRVTTLAPSVPLLRLAGYDGTRGRGIYQVALPLRNAIQD